MRLVGALGFRDDCRSTFRDKKILTLPSIYILESTLYVHTHKDEYRTGGFHHDYSTRKREHLSMDFVKRSRCRISSNHWGIKFYNVLPEEMKSLPPANLKKKLKTLLLNGAFYDLEEFLLCGFC